MVSLLPMTAGFLIGIFKKIASSRTRYRYILPVFQLANESAPFSVVVEDSTQAIPNHELLSKPLDNGQSLVGDATSLSGQPSVLL